MAVVWVQQGGSACVCATVFLLLTSVPVRAADDGANVTAVAAEELDKRSKQAEQAQGTPKGMSDSAVRVLMTYAFSIIKEDGKDADGNPVKIDKSDPNKYFIPTEDARRVIRAATRTAYAEVCQLADLGRLNFETLMKGERARNWSSEQFVMIEALHLFSVSYFTGNMKITAKEEPDQGDAGQAGGATAVSKGAPQAQGEGTTTVITSEAPACPPEQKQKVIKAINAYAQAAQAQ